MCLCMYACMCAGACVCTPEDEVRCCSSGKVHLFFFFSEKERVCVCGGTCEIERTTWQESVLSFHSVGLEN